MKSDRSTESLADAARSLSEHYLLARRATIGLNEAGGVIHVYFTRKTYLKTLPEAWKGYHVEWHSGIGKVKPAHVE